MLAACELRRAEFPERGHECRTRHVAPHSAIKILIKNNQIEDFTGAFCNLIIVASCPVRLLFLHIVLLAGAAWRDDR